MKKWYAHLDNYENNIEDTYRLLYYYLTHELFYYMLQKSIDWVHISAKLEGENFLKSELLDFLKKKSEESHEASKLWQEFANELQKKVDSRHL